jgi:hypothetical protein
VLRDFLRYGCDHPTGDGLVRIRPEADRRNVVLTLVEGTRSYAVRLPAEMLTRFLDATEEVCPSGEERNDVAVDALIDRLLRA